jgi:hypothetical protein
MNLQEYSNRRDLLVSRLKQLRIPPGVIPEEIMAALVSGDAIIVVQRVEGITGVIRVLKKPHPLEQVIEYFLKEP